MLPERGGYILCAHFACPRDVLEGSCCESYPEKDDYERYQCFQCDLYGGFDTQRKSTIVIVEEMIGKSRKTYIDRHRLGFRADDTERLSQ